jgi:hypothetical protein
VKKICYYTFFVVTNFTKLNLLPKKFSLSSQKYGFGIRDPISGIRDTGSGKNLLRIPDPGVKKAPDTGSGSATLTTHVFSSLVFLLKKALWPEKF